MFLSMFIILPVPQYCWASSRWPLTVLTLYSWLWFQDVAFVQSPVSLTANFFKLQAVGDIWPTQICLDFLWQEDLWIDRKIPGFQVPKLNGLVSRASRRVSLWRALIGLLRKMGFEIEISQRALNSPASFSLMSICDRKSFEKSRNLGGLLWAPPIGGAQKRYFWQ